jgi:aspartyl-tRNA(Asn)/glutamyl-tRNA(Gln) amidotransferase subunit A
VEALTAEQSIAAIVSGETSSEELVEEALGRAGDDPWGAFLTLDGDRARRRAREIDTAEDRPPLAGVPIAIKDVLSTRDLVTTAGSQILKGFRPLYTATCVERLERAGAVVVGKTNMDEFAMGSSTENSSYQLTRNPWDMGTVPGGSSGGSAATVAARQVPWSLGTDTGGSIRQPAALCGVVGMKPTYGGVSRYGLIAFASSLDQVGPIARTVRDSAMLLAHIVGHDPRDSTSLHWTEPIALPEAERLDGVRLGVIGEMLDGGVEPGVRSATEEAIATAQDLGAEISEVSLPASRHGIAAYYLIAPAEASANLARFDGMRYGLRAEAEDLLEHFEKTRGQGFGPEVKRRIMLGTFALASGYYDAYYARAQKVRTLIVRDFAAAFENVDLLLSPTSPTTAFRFGERMDDPYAMYTSDICTIPMSLAGLPAISIPCGLSGGLPVGLQLTGPAFSENALFAAAHALERAIGFDAIPETVA